jgi:uncharacterized protein YaiE (UPF0345 family)
VIICFSQQRGKDFTALPVPAGARVEATGWADDSGPLLRASTIQSGHPLLAGIKNATPEFQTSGYFASLPQQAQTLLTRPDGYATLALYPYGDGWVVLASLFPDVSHSQWGLTDDERTLVRDLLSWAAAAGAVTVAAPGGRATMNIGVMGGEQGSAESVRIMIAATSGGRPIIEQVLKVSVPEARLTSFPVTFAIPPDARQGVYRVDYQLHDSKGRALSPRVQALAGGVSIGRAPSAQRVPRAKQPLAAYPVKVTVHPVAEPAGRQLTVKLTVIAAGNAPARQFLIASAGGQEKQFSLVNGRAELSFDIPVAGAGAAVRCFVRHSNGRVLAGAIVPMPSAGVKGIVLDKSSYAPGEKASARLAGFAGGEVTLTGLGLIQTDVLKKNGSLDITIPSLPSGTYPLTWQVTGMDETIESGEVPVVVTGPAYAFRGAVVEQKADGKTRKVTATLTVDAQGKAVSNVELFLRSPDGSLASLARKSVELNSGGQEIPFTFSFSPALGGIHELLYTLSLPLPEGAGLSGSQVVVAAGRELIDAGDVAVLAMAPSPPVSYQPSGAVEAAAFVYSTSGKTTVELFANNDRVLKQKIERPGMAVVTGRMTELLPGENEVRVVAEGDRFDSVLERSLTYGGRLPDLAPELETAQPVGPAMPVAVTVTNRGKTASAPTTVTLSESRAGGKPAVIGSASVPALASGRSERVVITWPLAKRAGPRTLLAVVDPGKKLQETTRRNNTVLTETAIPDVVLSVTPAKKEFASDEPMSLSLRVVNLTTTTLANAAVLVQVTDPAGKAVVSETIALPGLEPGIEHTVQKEIAVAAPATGAYAVRAGIGTDKPLGVTTAAFTVLPTLVLRGSLDGTPSSSAPCRPFTIRYDVKSVGTVPALTGGVKIEILSRDGTPAYAKQLPLSAKPQSLTIEKLNIPRGQYTLRLNASAANEKHRLTREFKLAEQVVTVAGQVQVRKADSAGPRVLVWRGAAMNTLDRALSETIVKQAFEEQALYQKVVDNADEFRVQAGRGLFNIFVLFEIDEAPESWEWLRTLVSQGQALVIIGEGVDTRRAAEAFGYSFDEPLNDQQRVLTLTGKAALELGGTIPVSGRMLRPKKKAAQAVAFVAGTDQAGALVDRSGKGAVAILPFSFIRSARSCGTNAIYSLTLRTAVRSLAPKIDDAGGTASQELIVSSATGPVKAKIIVTLPPGARPLWANQDGAVAGNVITFHVTAGRDGQSLLYLYDPPQEAGEKPVHSVFYDCAGSYVSQEGVE